MGKSLVYFVCTKLLRDAGKGITIVVSPLLVLMENQLQAAESLGLCCTILNSRTKNQRAEQIKGMKNDCFDIAFVTPETLFTTEVQSALTEIQIGLFVIDEAHCISDWGHDFRLEYMRLNRVIQKMPLTVPVLGTTATANDRVIADLQKQFGKDVFISRGELMRHSLSIQILSLSTPAERYAWMLQNIPLLPSSGIVYCLTQRDSENIADFLQKNGIAALAYHSGLEQEEADTAEQKFHSNQIKVLVATVKLGMGYDKDDIAFVIHYQQPSNIVAYYQQIGRAGRKLERAYTFLMCGEEDSTIQNYFIETAFPSEEEAHSIYEVILEHAEYGITANKLGCYVNIRKNRVDKALMFLQNEEIVHKEGTKYFPTLNPFRYNREHYESVKHIRYMEQRQMSELPNTLECLSRFVVNCLDDSTESKCGICRNCLGYDEFPIQPKHEFIEAAQTFHEKLQLSIKPRKQWPDKENFTGSTRIMPQNEIGICLAKYGDSGYGAMVKKGKYGMPQGFSMEIVEKSAKVLLPIIADKQIDAITCVPSLRSKIVMEFAVQLAERCGIPFVNTLQKTRSKQQKKMENSFYQCKNAWDSFSLLPELKYMPKRLILVDDIVDSKWTMTVCGYRLAQAGCELVFPFALADSSENRRKED